MDTAQETALSSQADQAAAAGNIAELRKQLQSTPALHAHLGQCLLNEGRIDAAALNAALEQQRRCPHQRLGEILCASGIIQQADLQAAIATSLNLPDIPNVDLSEFEVDPHAIALLPLELARRYHAMPLMFHEDALVVAISEIPDLDTMQELRFATQHLINIVWAAGGEAIDRAIERNYPVLEETLGLNELALPETLEEEDQRQWKEAERLAQKQPLVRLVNALIEQAILLRASDIHILPREKTFELLYRVDGNLIKVREFRRGLLPAVVSRIKIMSRLNIAERRLPQDGHIHFSEAGVHEVDLRISIIPVQYGESVVIRILSKQEGVRSLDQIGFGADDLEAFRRLIKHSYGILLVTGPTGSGKTTTLYAVLQEVAKDKVNIITVEDPIEYDLAGMRQIQLVQAIGFDFPQALRHILRHDPDVIMIGEMRDLETCKIAVESALTGHLVLSTLHTNDAPSAVVRLLEMGIEPYLAKSTVIGVLAQRLVRKNCPQCQVEEHIDRTTRAQLGLGQDEKFYCGSGCEACHHTGFAGRAAIYELLEVTDAFRNHISETASAEELRRLAIAGGMRTMAQHGVELARQRLVSITEVYRSCM
jgi:type IV pilus assembly protein PilB